MEKRYYWLKLKEDFFNSKQIKKLRRMAGGDTYTIIYLKMQLKSLKSDGVIQYTGLESEFAEELALDIDESVDDVKMTLAFLQSCNLIETSDYINYFLPAAVENTGSECDSARRVREYREKQYALQCNNDVTTCNALVTSCNTEKEKETEQEKEKKEDKDIEQEQTATRRKASLSEDVESVFESLWTLYPKKKGKRKVSAKAKRELYDAGKDVVAKAIENYKAYLAAKGWGDEYTKQGSTFFNGDWQDFVDDDTSQQEEDAGKGFESY